MELTKETTIFALTDRYPFLIEALAGRNKNFAKLKNPLLRQSIGRIATMEKAADLGKEKLLDLMFFIAGEIMAATGESVTITPPAGIQAAAPATLSRGQRLERLKEIIKSLHAGAPFDEVRKKFNETVGDIAPEEIAALEQTLVNEGLPETEIKRLCHLHAALFHDTLEGRDKPLPPLGHPARTYLEENSHAKALLGDIRRQAARAEGEKAEAAWPFALAALRPMVQKLSDLLTHYTRKENQLFPLLERHGLSAPGKVMWAVHDDIREKFRRARGALQGEKREDSLAAVRDLADEVEEMIRKEENILFPMSIELLNEEDWNDCRLGDDEIGYAFGVTPGNDWVVGAVSAGAGAAAGDGAGTEKAGTGPGTGPGTGAGTGDRDGAGTEKERGGAQAAQAAARGIALATGRLAPEVIDAILRNLPVDISFVGPDDRVVYYSDSEHRVFPRSAAVIGREVKNCHPPKSVHMVTEILEAFKSGARDKAEFWLETGGKFIHIQYLALKSGQGEYLGCLEVSQDATRLRSLTGQRRLLEWE